MHGIRRAHGADQEPVEVLRVHPVEHELVDVREPAGAEVVVAVSLEVVVGQPAVGDQLLAVAEIVPIGDLEVAARVEVDPRAPGRDQAERAPLQ